MKKATYLMSFLLLALLAQAELVEDFESYSTGDVVTVATSAWTAIGSTTYADIATSAGNNYITYGDTTGYFGAYRALPTAVSNTSTATLFLRVCATSTAVNHSFGLSANSTPTWFSAFETQIALLSNSTSTSVGLSARNSGTTTSVSTLNLNQWYNIWAVVDQTTDKYDVYLTTGTESATSSNKVASQFGFRNGTTSDLVTFLVMAGPVGEVVRVDDVYVTSGTDLTNPLALKAHDPSPATAATGVLTTATLSWSTGMSSSDPTSVNSAITKHYVYMNTDPNLVGKLVATVTASDTTGSYTPSSGLDMDVTYYWRVDESVNGSSASDSNTIVGPVWAFDMEKSMPSITTQPSTTLVYPTETATFSVVFTSVTTPTVVWKKYVDGTTNDTTVTTSGAYTVSLANDGTTYTATLTVTNPTSTQEGQYYCNLTNTGNSSTTVTSDTVTLGVKRQVAHWTLNNDITGWDGTYYLDSSDEGHDADPNGTPSFVADVNGTADSAVTIDTTNGYATAGTWNPSAYTDQFTVSLWVKWAGQGTTTTWQGLISKETSYGEDTMMWQLEMTSAATASSELVLKNGLETNNLASDVLPVDTWEHVALTWDGTTATIYRNGVSDASGTWAPGTQTEAEINLGISAFSTSENLMFNGAMDDIQIYNYAKTQKEVITIYNAMSGESTCINQPTYDFDDDCKVTLSDFAIFASNWLKDGLYE